MARGGGREEISQRMEAAKWRVVITIQGRMESMFMSDDIDFLT